MNLTVVSTIDIATHAVAALCQHGLGAGEFLSSHHCEEVALAGGLRHFFDLGFSHRFVLLYLSVFISNTVCRLPVGVSDT
jgi:hypothetical protein